MHLVVEVISHDPLSLGGGMHDELKFSVSNVEHLFVCPGVAMHSRKTTGINDLKGCFILYVQLEIGLVYGLFMYHCLFNIL